MAPGSFTKPSGYLLSTPAAGIVFRPATREKPQTGQMWHYLHMNADMQVDVDGPHVELAVEVFSLLADATRVRLILVLGDGELPVNALAERVGKPASAVSQHLAKMRLGGMVATRQEGTKVYYRLRDSHASQLVMDAIHQAEHALGTAPRHGA